MQEISIETQSQEELAMLVKKVDPELTFIKDLHPTASTCRTLLVNHAGSDRILKVREISTNIWDDTYFYYEINALRRVAEKDLSGVTHMVGEYKTDKYHAILKTYAEGTPCNNVDHEKLLLDQEFIKKLDALYMKLHLAGIAKIHYQPRKIIIGPDDELTLVDLSTCITHVDSGVGLFSYEMRGDSFFITGLEKRARAAAAR